jgi:hypothetical protein
MTELQDHLAAYLRGEMTLRQFEEWFVPTTWDARDENDPRVELVRNIIDARIAEFTHGDWDEDELKDLLRPFVETKVIPLAASTDGPPHLRTAVQSSVRRVPLTITLGQGVGRLLAPNPQVLASRPDSLDDEAERNPHEQFVLQA